MSLKSLFIFAVLGLTKPVLADLPQVPTDGADSESFYWLVCKGGGQTGTADQVVTELNNFQLHIPFKRGHQASGPHGENLAAGECSWPDRGMYDSEPTNLFTSYVPGRILRSLKIDSEGRVLSESYSGLNMLFMMRNTAVYVIRVKATAGSATSFSTKIDTIQKVNNR